MDVVYEEVKAGVEEDDFIIKPVTTMEAKEEEVIEHEDEDQQITLTFDLPLPTEKVEEQEPEEKITYSLDEDEVKDLPVNDYVELITVTETNEDGNDIRYALDDYIEAESAMNPSKTKVNEVVEEVQEDIVFERKVLQEDITETSEEEDVEATELPISEILKQRTAERRRKMKDFNYKFNNSKIDDIEKVPAYKRQGVNLDEAKHSSETDMSRTSVGLDDNDDIQIRTNNSFLHDNVD